MDDMKDEGQENGTENTGTGGATEAQGLVGSAVGAGVESAVESGALKTVEEIIQQITNTSTPQASAGVLIDWTVSMLKNALHLGGMAATADAVQAHVAILESSKEDLAAAVAA